MAKTRKPKAKKKEKKLTQPQVKCRIEDFLCDLEWLFDYQNWDRRVVFETTDKDSCAAEVTTDAEYRRILIKIYPAYFTHSPRDQRLFLLHEFCHSYTDRVYKMGIDLLNGKLRTNDMLNAANEEATSRITDILDALLRGKMRYARKSYARYLDAKKK